MSIGFAEFFIDVIDGNRLILLVGIYRNEEKSFIFNGFPVIACISSNLRISWFCKFGHPFSSTNKAINASTKQ
jgi:hypothetical protein